MDEAEIRELERQLACPNGKHGIEVANTMHESNNSMTLNSVDFLEPKNNCKILELGHGNCGHLEKVFQCADNIQYCGLEISETMLAQAKHINSDKPAEFTLYDGENIPYADNFFDRVFSINTVYFWHHPEALVREIERTLKPEGTCVLTYANKDFMRGLPFVGERFRLFDREEMLLLVGQSNLKIQEFKELRERVKSKSGEMVERVYTMVKIKK